MHLFTEDDAASSADYDSVPIPYALSALPALNKVMLISRSTDKNDTAQYSLTLRGKEFEPGVEIFNNQKLKTGCVGAFAIGGAAAYGALKFNMPPLLAISNGVAGFGVGGVSQLKLNAIRNAISAQKSYDEQITQN